MGPDPASKTQQFCGNLLATRRSDPEFILDNSQTQTVKKQSHKRNWLLPTMWKTAEQAMTRIQKMFYLQRDLYGNY